MIAVTIRDDYFLMHPGNFEAVATEKRLSNRQSCTRSVIDSHKIWSYISCDSIAGNVRQQSPPHHILSKLLTFLESRATDSCL
jgi:hypothetical protein